MIKLTAAILLSVCMTVAQEPGHHHHQQHLKSRTKRQILASRVIIDSWSNCDHPQGPISEWPLQLTDLLVSKNPILIPGEITVKLEARFNQPVDTYITAKIEIMRDVLIFKNIAIPCFNVTGGRIGSCEYKNICSKSFMPNYVDCDNSRNCRCNIPSRAEPHDLILNFHIPKPPKIQKRVDAKGIYKIKVLFFDKRLRELNDPLMCVKATAIVE